MKASQWDALSLLYLLNIFLSDSHRYDVHRCCAITSIQSGKEKRLWYWPRCLFGNKLKRLWGGDEKSFENVLGSIFEWFDSQVLAKFCNWPKQWMFLNFIWCLRHGSFATNMHVQAQSEVSIGQNFWPTFRLKTKNWFRNRKTQFVVRLTFFRLAFDPLIFETLGRFGQVRLGLE